MQQVQTSLLPFSHDFKSVNLPEGLSLKEIVDLVFSVPIRDTEVIVTVNNHVVPKSAWASVKPKPHTIVGLNIVPAGGGGGKKNPLTTIISLAVAIAAPYAIAAIAPATAAAVAAGTATFGQMALYGALRIGIGMVGYLATSMLSSTPKQSFSGYAQNIAESTTQFIEGATNQVLKYGVIPVCLGTNRMFPPQAALPYTETVGNNQYVRQVFTYGYGKVLVQDRQIGETSLAEYSEIEIEEKLNADLNSGIGLYANDVYQEGMNVVLSYAAGEVIRTTQLETDEAEVDVTFFQGLTQFDDRGLRKNITVEFEMVYSLTGENDWSVGLVPQAVTSTVLSIPEPYKTYTGNSYRYDGQSVGLIIMDTNTGDTQVLAGNYSTAQGTTVYPPVPSGFIRIGSYRKIDNGMGGFTTTVVDETANAVPAVIQNTGDFALTVTGESVNVAAGTVNSKTYRVTDSTAQPLRKSYRIKFPSRGQYDVRLRRVNADNNSDKIRDVMTITALKSITFTNPIEQADISGIAIRMKATDQLNGSIDRYNAIVSSIGLGYDPDEDDWIEKISSNPADLYRYVLQSEAFIKRLPDNRINIAKLEEWWQYCFDNNLTYDRVIDYETSVDNILDDICAAGMASKSKVNGIYSVVIDNEKPIISGVVTPRNSWGYTGNINYPEIPHALRIQFRNSRKGYEVDERIVYADGYSAANATEYERLEFNSCTHPTLAYFYGKRYFANAILQPETHKFYMDVEAFTFNRGDRITFINDVILVGVGQGRIKTLIYDDDETPTQVLGFTIDDVVDIPTTNQFAVRIRHADASGNTYHLLTTVVGQTDTFTFATPVDVAEAPGLTSLCSFVEDGLELDLLITEIRIGKNHTAQITAINYAPERFDPLGTIPAFSSNITLPSGFYAPLAPELSGSPVSDESVMNRNSDGSYTSRMIINLINRNEPSVSTYVLAQPVGATQWFKPDVLKLSPETVVLTGLQDGTNYNFRIFYQRAEGKQLLSLPLELNNTKYVGASTRPASVTGFKVTVSDTTGLFEWDLNLEIDIAYYSIKFSRLTTGVLWKNAQYLAEKVYTNRVSLPIQSGTYLIKAVDILGNESEVATTIVSANDGAFNNVVANLDQEPDWPGTHDNTHVISGSLYLIDPTQIGYYYFDPEPFDLSEIYENTLSSSLETYLTTYNRIRAAGSIRALSSIRGTSDLNIRSQASIRSLSSIRGFDGIDWSVILEINTSDDNITWSGWETFTAGKKIFRYVKFRLVLETSDPATSPRVDIASVTIDMPDRYETAEDVEITVAASGATVVYDYQFRNNPSVNITLQNGDVDDRIEYLSKTSEGFTIRVYNATLGGYVTRSFDYVSAGYGRVL